MTTPADSKNPSRDPARPKSEDAQFVATLTAHYSPEPMSEAGRRDFDRSLASRLAAPNRTWRATPIVAATAVAAALAWIAAPALFSDPPPLAEFDRAEAFAAAEWESQLFDTVGFDDSEGIDQLEDLPDDYAAIAGLLLDG